MRELEYESTSDSRYPERSGTVDREEERRKKQGCRDAGASEIDGGGERGE